MSPTALPARAGTERVFGSRTPRSRARCPRHSRSTSTGEPVRQFAYTPPHHNLVATQGAVPITRANAARTASPCDEIRSEEHTSELQSRQYLVCRLLLEKKNFI